MEKLTLEKMAVMAFATLSSAREALFTAAENTIEAQSALDADKAAAVNAGKFDGKNAEIREAQAREYLSGQHDAVSECGRKERAARYKLDAAQIDVDTVKTLLRIAELTD